MAASGTRARPGAIRLPFGSRADATELLDEGRLTAAEVDANLADLARLNRLPGGRHASLAAIRRLLGPSREASVLDAGTGRADLAVAFVREGWRATAIDVNHEVLRSARRAVGSGTDVALLQADVRALPFADGVFDVAHCSLLAHHLEPDELVTALRELSRVARAGVVVNDVRRGVWPYLASGAAMAVLARSRVTISDGLTSVRRAYTLGELDAHARLAGLTPAWRSPAWWPRVATAFVTR